MRQEFPLPKGTGQVVLKTESQLAQLVPSLDFNPRAFNFPAAFCSTFSILSPSFRAENSLSDDGF